MCIPCVSEKFKRMKRSGHAPGYDRNYGKFDENEYEEENERFYGNRRREKRKCDNEERKVERKRERDEKIRGCYKKKKRFPSDDYYSDYSEFQDYKTIDSRDDTGQGRQWGLRTHDKTLTTQNFARSLRSRSPARVV